MSDKESPVFTEIGKAASTAGATNGKTDTRAGDSSARQVRRVKGAEDPDVSPCYKG